MTSQYKIKVENLKRLKKTHREEPTEELRQAILRLDTELKRINSMVGAFTTPHGNYKKAIG